MAKNIIKETIIILLLCLAIILVLGVLLYGYVPSASLIPEKVSYTTPANVKEELQAVSDIDESKIILTYEVDSKDLSNYAKIQDYKPGKTNPFSAGTQTSGENTTNGSSSGNNTTGTETNGSANTTNSSGGTYFQDKGTK